MKVKLMTDAPEHNLALMKISSYHKSRGDEVLLGRPEDLCDKSYGSWLFNRFDLLNPADFLGGSAIDPKIKLPSYIENLKPDYDLFPINYSLGYTWPYCPRKCSFCVVPRQNNPKTHHSIWDFHNERFNKICLLNNNTFSDPRWKETFEEIWEANLTVIDQNGFDLRLLDKEKLEYLNKTRFDGLVHFAWDFIKDEQEIRRGLSLLKGLKHHPYIYVLIGYPWGTWLSNNDFHRCEVLASYGFEPFIMVYNRIKRSREPRMRQLNQFARMVNHVFTWRSMGFREAWRVYKAR